jgi:hypothetical protein
MIFSLMRNKQRKNPAWFIFNLALNLALQQRLNCTGFAIEIPGNFGKSYLCPGISLRIEN